MMLIGEDVDCWARDRRHSFFSHEDRFEKD